MAGAPGSLTGSQRGGNFVQRHPILLTAILAGAAGVAGDRYFSRSAPVVPNSAYKQTHDSDGGIANLLYRADTQVRDSDLNELIHKFRNAKQDDGQPLPNDVVMYDNKRLLLRRYEQGDGSEGIEVTVVVDANKNGLPDFAMDFLTAKEVGARRLSSKEAYAVTVVGDRLTIAGSNLDTQDKQGTGNGYLTK